MKIFMKVITTNESNLILKSNRIKFYSSKPRTNDKNVGDITYKKLNNGTMYLATVIDQIILKKNFGWSMDDTMKVSKRDKKFGTRKQEWENYLIYD